MGKTFYLGSRAWVWVFPGFGYCLFFVRIPKPSRMLAHNPGRVYGCNCDVPSLNDKRYKYHRKTCKSCWNEVWYYRMSLWESFKSLFQPAHKIFNFYQDEPKTT